MSEIPTSKEGIISQILGLDWPKEKDKEEVRTAVKKTIEGDENIQQAVTEIRRAYGRESWRDFRTFTATKILDEHVDVEKLREEISL